MYLFLRHSMLGRKVVGEAFADAAVDAVGRDDQIGVAKSRKIVGLALELQPDAECAGALLEDVQQALAGDADEARPPKRTTCPLKCTSMSSQR